jgi:hypothetical protein
VLKKQSQAVAGPLRNHPLPFRAMTAMTSDFGFCLLDASVRRELARLAAAAAAKASADMVQAMEGGRWQSI